MNLIEMDAHAGNVARGSSNLTIFMVGYFFFNALNFNN